MMLLCVESNFSCIPRGGDHPRRDKCSYSCTLIVVEGAILCTQNPLKSRLPKKCVPNDNTPVWLRLMVALKCLMFVSIIVVFVHMHTHEKCTCCISHGSAVFLFHIHPMPVYLVDVDVFLLLYIDP